MIKILLVILCVIAVAIVAVVLFLQTPSFGRLPRGERLERIKRSPNFRDGEFRNMEPTVLMTSEKGKWGAMLDFVFKKSPEGLRPEHPVPSVKTDLRALDPDRELLVWFGHSSYLFQLGGKRILVDPVFCGAAPVSFLNKPFPGTDIYRPEDMPDIDCLVITHDHWDHLDYGTVTRLKGGVSFGCGRTFRVLGLRTGTVGGVGLERDGYVGRRCDGTLLACPSFLRPWFAVEPYPVGVFSGRSVGA